MNIFPGINVTTTYSKCKNVYVPYNIRIIRKRNINEFKISIPIAGKRMDDT